MTTTPPFDIKTSQYQCIKDTVAERSEFDCYQEHHLREEWFEAEKMCAWTELF
jgi:hypothetical protein